MPRPISEFFVSLGFPLKNPRWSWGGENGRGILLRTWENERNAAASTVLVLAPPGSPYPANGHVERISHVRKIWEGEFNGYAIVVKAVDPKRRPRSITSYSEDEIFPIQAFLVADDRSISAVLGRPISVEELRSRSRLKPKRLHELPFPSSDFEISLQ